MTKPKAEPMDPLIEGYLSYLAKVGRKTPRTFLRVVFGDVLRDDLARGAMLVSFHVSHQLLVLLGGHSFTARNRRKSVGQEQLQGDDFGHDLVRANGKP